MQRMRLVLLATALAILAVACWLTGCGGGRDKPAASGPETTASPAATASSGSAPAAKAPVVAPPPVDPIVVVHTSQGDFKVQLFTAKSPQTVENFLTTYVKRGFYDETIFHHVEAGSMLIGGGYTADLSPKPTLTPVFNESRNGLSNRRGTVAMIHLPDVPHSATSQFFINLTDNPALDYKPTADEEVYGYCVFGEVVEGMEVVEQIAKLPTAAQQEFANVPSPTVAIKSIQRLR